MCVLLNSLIREIALNRGLNTLAPDGDIGGQCGLSLVRGGVKRMLNGLQALVAEDNVTNQIVAKEMLQSLGATPTIVSDGVEAIEVLERRKFDVLFIDIEMPRLSGIEVMTRLRSGDGPNAGAPMIVLTAYVMADRREVIDAAGADGVIAKPIVSIEEFGQRVQAIIARRQSDFGDGPLQNDLPVFDPRALDRLAQLAGPDSVARVLGTARRDVQMVTEALIAALAAGDVDEAKAQGHSLAGMAGAVGAVGLEREAREIDRMPEQAVSRGMALVRRLNEILALTLPALEAASVPPAPSVMSEPTRRSANVS